MVHAMDRLREVGVDLNTSCYGADFVDQAAVENYID